MEKESGAPEKAKEQRSEPELTSNTIKIAATANNVNNNEPSSGRSVNSRKKAALRAPPTAVRSSVISIQNDLSTMSLKNESVSNLEEDLNPARACTHCVGSKVKQVHRFLDKINGKLIRTQQERKNTMNNLAKNIGVAKMKLQNRKLEEDESQKALEELANKQKLLEKLLRITMKNYHDLFTKETNQHQPHRKIFVGNKFSNKLVKLSGTSRVASKSANGGVTKSSPHSVINHPICRVLLDAVFKDVSSKSYRSYLFNKVICPAEKQVQNIFKATRKPKIKRPRSHEPSIGAVDGPSRPNYNDRADRKAKLRMHPGHREIRQQTRGGAYSQRMVKTSRENNEKHGPRSSSDSDFDSSTEDVQKHEVVLEDTLEGNEHADHVLGSLPNSFQAFQDLARADRGFYHSVYNRVPHLETDMSLRTFESPPSSNSGIEGLEIYSKKSDSDPAKSRSEKIQESSPKRQHTTIEVMGPYSVITIHRKMGFDVEDKRSIDFENNCGFITKFLETKKLELEAERINNTGKEEVVKKTEPGATYPDEDSIDGDNAEALESDDCGDAAVATAAEREKATPGNVGNVPPSRQASPVTPILNGSGSPTTAVNYDDDSFEESESETMDERSQVSHVVTDHSEPEAPEKNAKKSPLEEIMGSRDNLADVSNSASEEVVTGLAEPKNEVETQQTVTVLDAAVEVKQKLMQTQWGELVTRFNTPPSDHSQLKELKEHASTATLKFPTMKSGNRIEETLKNIGLGFRISRKEAKPKRPPSRLDKNRRSGSNRFPAPKLPPATPVFKTLTVNDTGVKIVDVLGPGAEPPSSAVRRLNTKTAILPPRRGTYRQLGTSPNLQKPPSTVVIAEPYRIRNSRVAQDQQLSSTRKLELRPLKAKSITNKSYQSYKPAKISAHGLMKSIREFQIKNGLLTPRKQSAASTFDGTSIRRKQNLVGLSTILKSSMATNARAQAIHKQSKFPLPPTQRDIQHEVRRRLVSNITQKEANSPFYTVTRNSVANNTTRRLQDAFIRKLPKPYIPASVPVPVPPPDFGRRPRPAPLYSFKSIQNRQQLTLSALKSSRVTKPVPRKELPIHLRYGNFSSRLWPQVCARFPSPARSGSRAQRHFEVMQSRVAPNLNFTSAAGLRRYKIRNIMNISNQGY